MDRKIEHSLEELLAMLNLDNSGTAINKMYLEFKSFTTDEERISFIRQLTPLKDKNFLNLDDVDGYKSLSKSVEFRLEGNEAFRKNDHNLALMLYTKSIATAPQPKCKLEERVLNNGTFDSETALSLAVANRSGVLFIKREYILCLEDISYALKMGYPQNLIYKLYIRQLKCFEALGRGEDVGATAQLALESLLITDKITENEKQSRRKEVEKIQLEVSRNKRNKKQQNTSDCFPRPEPSYGRNNSLLGCSDCVEMKMTTDMGRGLFATRDIEIGDIIATSKPFVSILFDDFAYIHCHNCCKRCNNLIPCIYCSTALFCNEECRDTAWVNYHSLECHLLPALKHSNLLPSGARALRTVIVAANMFKSLTEFHEVTKLFDMIHEKGVDWFPHTVLGKYFDYYQVYLATLTYAPRSAPQILMNCLYGTYLSLILEKGTKFFSIHTSNEKVESRSLENLKIFIAGLLMKHIQNPTHEIKYYEKVGTKIDESFIGQAAYPLAVNLINHSCHPNVFHHTAYDNQIVVRAINCIKKGEQIFDSYGPTYTHHSLEERSKILSKYHSFLCHCIACSENWPTLAEMAIDTHSGYRQKCASCGSALPDKLGSGLFQLCGSCGHKNNVSEMPGKVCRAVTKIQNSRGDVKVTLQNTINFIKLMNTHFLDPNHDVELYRESAVKLFLASAFKY